MDYQGCGGRSHEEEVMVTCEDPEEVMVTCEDPEELSIVRS